MTQRRLPRCRCRQLRHHLSWALLKRMRPGSLIGIGLSMTIGGVVQMLTPQPRFNVGASSDADNKANYAFGTPVNTVAMGYPVPLLYGEREIGGAIISAGIFSSDQQ